MLFRRVAEYLREHNWTAVAIDFVVVVIGVFLGMEAQQWAEERGRVRLEAAYTQRLHDEVVELQATRSPLVNIRERWHSGLKTATEALYGDEGRSLSAEECLSIGFSHIVSNPTDDLASLLELQSSGGLAMFRDERVSAALRSYLLARARTRDALAGSASSPMQLASRYPALVRVMSASDTETMTLGTYRCDVEGMRSSQPFLNDYEIAQTNFSLHVRANGGLNESLGALHRVLDEALGVFHRDPSS